MNVYQMVLTLSGDNAVCLYSSIAQQWFKFDDRWDCLSWLSEHPEHSRRVVFNWHIFDDGTVAVCI